ncbi:hypothetical protein H2200_011143 [Cladophialophora chaetospira]|uniref:Uncharacterized protein n=1 Tax=Cladophialophora chaetospira TaxID=386627 RepID=A0AA39CDJ3_9EURO|nr:hypothetical protein H2200_011143 [Cladophialophora chaetospira]
MPDTRPSESHGYPRICTTCKATVVDVLSRIPTHAPGNARDYSAKVKVDPEPPAPPCEARRHCEGYAGDLTTKTNERTFPRQAQNTASKPKMPPPATTNKHVAWADERVWHVSPKTALKPKPAPTMMNQVNTYGYGVIGGDPRAIQGTGRKDEVSSPFKTAVDLGSVKEASNPTKSAIDLRYVKEAANPINTAVETGAVKEASSPSRPAMNLIPDSKTAVETGAVKQMPVAE